MFGLGLRLGETSRGLLEPPFEPPFEPPLWLSGLCLESPGLLALYVFTVLVRPWNLRTLSSSDKIQLGRMPAPMQRW